MSEIVCVPVTVNIPTTALLVNTARITLPLPRIFQQAELIELSGSLSTLVSGAFTVEVRRKAGALIDTLSWTATGDVINSDIGTIFDQPNGGLRFDVTSLGVGALNCYITAWFAVG